MGCASDYPGQFLQERCPSALPRAGYCPAWIGCGSRSRSLPWISTDDPMGCEPMGLRFSFRQPVAHDRAFRAGQRVEVDRWIPVQSHVAASFLRLVTNPRIFIQPSSLEEAWAFVDTLESRGEAVKAVVDAMTFGIFKHLCLVTKAMGNDIPDALLASLALRHDATLITADRRFGGYEGLSCRFVT